MRICLLRPLPDSRRWSMDLYSRSLGQALKPLLRPDESVEIYPPEADFASWRVPAGPTAKPVRYWQQYVLYGLRAKHLQADLYHITDHGYLNLIPFLPPAPVVVTCHDLLLNNLQACTLPVHWKPQPTIFAQRWAQRWLASAVRVITDSEFIRWELARWADVTAERAAVIPLGVAPVFFQRPDQEKIENFRRKYQLQGKKILLIAGRVDPHKNIEGALKAMARLAPAMPEMMLLKVGAEFTPEQTVLQKKLKLEGRVICTGTLDEADLVSAYHVSDALVFLSWYEGFGLPAIEAMAAGLPCLLSDRGSLPEVAGAAALLTNPEDEDETAARLRQILTDVKLRQELIDKGKMRAEKFTWEKTARQTLEVYRALVRTEK